jgi:hypothetical protein
MGDIEGDGAGRRAQKEEVRKAGKGKVSFFPYDGSIPWLFHCQSSRHVTSLQSSPVPYIVTLSEAQKKEENALQPHIPSFHPGS